LGFQISEDGSTIDFFELKDRKWRPFKDLSTVNNRKANTLHYTNHWWYGNKFGEFFAFSDVFPTYCWVNSDGNANFSNWIENAAAQAGR
jgi:hypothetical protein